MNKTLFLVLLLLLGLTNYAQDTKIYLDSNWKQVEDASNATYYREFENTSGQDYKVTQYYTDDTIAMKGMYKDVLDVQHLSSYLSTVYRQDSFVYYHPNGAIMSVGTYRNGCRVGVWNDYYETGVLQDHTVYNNGKVDSSATYYESGRIERLMVFNGAPRPKTYYYEDVDIDASKSERKKKRKERRSQKNRKKEIFTYVEQMPEPGYNIYEIISNEVKYPPYAEGKKLEERVAVKFVVAENGDIVGIEPATIYKEVRFMLEAIRVVSTFPKWQPGKQNGTPVKVYYTLPLSFKL